MTQINHRGVSLIASLVAIVFVGLCAVLLTQLFAGHSRTQWSTQNRMRGDQVMVVTAASIQEMDFDAIRALCTTYGALSGPRTGACIASGALNSSATQYDPVRNPAQLEVLRDWNGKPVVDGKACVEISQCVMRANGRLVEVTLQGHWWDPKRAVNSRMLSFRKSRW